MNFLYPSEQKRSWRVSCVWIMPGVLKQIWYFVIAFSVFTTGLLLCFFNLFAFQDNNSFHRHSIRADSKMSAPPGLSVSTCVYSLVEENPTLANSKHVGQVRQSTCSPKDTVMFLKTHKTGSSTVTSILNMYGSKNNLTFALPKLGSTFGWPKRFKFNYALTTWTSPHILCNHARYNRIPLNYLFPKDRSTYVTILREPLAQYESAVNYLKLWQYVGIPGNNSMEVLEKYLLSVSSVKSAKLSLEERSRLLRNPMLYDLGLDFRYYQDKKAVINYMKFLEKEFDLVMILEYFDESVVLLKRLMCWEVDDVVFIKHNERQSKNKRKVSPLLAANIKSWNQADFMLYDHFNKTFWKKIAAEGPDFYDDLARFRKRKQEVFDMCVGPKPILDEINEGQFIKGYVLRNSIPKENQAFCNNEIKNQLKFLDEIRATQKKRQEQLENPGEFPNEFDKNNDWDKGPKDLAHIPIHAMSQTANTTY